MGWTNQLKRRLQENSTLRKIYYSSMPIGKLERHRVAIGNYNITIFLPKKEAAKWRAFVRGEIQLTGFDHMKRFEYVFANAFGSLIDANTVVFDIGASFGSYSVLAHNLGAGSIVSFEPDPFAAWTLQQNNRRLCGRRLRVVEQAVLSRGNADATSIDEFVETSEEIPSLIKMDIEGYEFWALQGAKQTLQTHHPELLLEFHFQKMRDDLDVDPEETLQLIRDCGYKIRFNGHHFHVTQHGGEVDGTWHAEPPNDQNVAIHAVWTKK